MPPPITSTSNCCSASARARPSARLAPPVRRRQRSLDLVGVGHRRTLRGRSLAGQRLGRPLRDTELCNFRHANLRERPPRRDRRGGAHAVRARGHAVQVSLRASSSGKRGRRGADRSARSSTARKSTRSSSERSCRRCSRRTSRARSRCCRCCRRECQAYTVSRACASANQAITDAADQIALGHADVVDRRRRRVAVERADPALARDVAKRSSRASQGEDVSAAREASLARDPPARSRADHAGDRRAVHRRDDGPVGREDGEDQPHPARGAGSVRAALAPARGRGHARTAGSRPRSCRSTCRRSTRRGRRATTAFAPTRSIEQLRGAQAGVRPQVRHGDGGQLVAAHRRRAAPCCS